MQQNALMTTATTASSTLGAGGLVCIVALGGGAVGTLSVLDGTAAKFSKVVAITADYTSLVFVPPVAFKNLILSNSGTMSYSVVYVPRP